MRTPLSEEIDLLALLIAGDYSVAVWHGCSAWREESWNKLHGEFVSENLNPLAGRLTFAKVQEDTEEIKASRNKELY